MANPTRGYGLLKRLKGIDAREVQRIAEEAANDAVRRMDQQVRAGISDVTNQPSRVAGAAARPVGTAGSAIGKGLLGAGAFVGTGYAIQGGASAYESFSQRETQKELNQIDKERADAIADLLADDSLSGEDKADIIAALEDAGFFEDVEVQKDSWLDALGIDTTAFGIDVDGVLGDLGGSILRNTSVLVLVGVFAFLLYERGRD